MKKLIFSISFLLALTVEMMSSTACSKDKVNQVSSSVKTQFQADSTTLEKTDSLPESNNLDPLAMKLLESNTLEVKSFNDINSFVKKIEAIAVPCYQLQDKNNLSDQEKTLKILDKVAKYAEGKLEGSTSDMVEGSQLNQLILNYKTARNIIKMHQQSTQNPTSDVSRETEAWQKLERTLCSFYGVVANLSNFGGTIAQVDAACRVWDLAQARHDDIEQLMSVFDPNAKNSPASNKLEKATNSILTVFTTTAKSFKSEEEYRTNSTYRELVGELNKTCQNLNTDLLSWFKARVILLSHCKDQKKALDGTIKMLNKIKKLGTPEDQE